MERNPLMVQVVIAFDKEFQDQPDEIIFQTILAANFLDIKNLLELMCKKVLTSPPQPETCAGRCLFPAKLTHSVDKEPFTATRI